MRKRGKPVVVVADPVDGTRELLETVFRDELGARVVAVRDGSSLLVQSREMVTHLVVLELNPQLGTDVDFVRKLKADPVTAPIPLLCMTAWGPNVTCEEALAAGAEACVAKPFDLDELLDRAEHLIAQRQRALAPA